MDIKITSTIELVNEQFYMQMWNLSFKNLGFL